MDIGAIRARIVEIQQSVPGVKVCHAKPPMNLPDLPAFVTYVGRASYDNSKGSGVLRCTRTFVMRLYLKDVGAELADGELDGMLEEFVEQTVTAFGRIKRLAVPWVESSRLTSDGGSQVFSLPGGTYLGTEFGYEVTELMRV